MNLSFDSFPPETLSALAQASAAINSTLELDVVLDRIARGAATVMRAEAASVLMLDRRRDKLVFTAAVGQQGGDLLGKEFDAKLGIAGRVLQSGRPENVADVSESPDFFPGIDEQSSFRTRDLIAAPMIYKSETIGVIEVLNRVDASPFGPGDLGLLGVFANLAASAVRNARAHEDLRRENLALRGSVASDARVIGRSEPVQKMLELAERVAPTNATVLLVGETGTGKEVLARYIHQCSPRRDRPFVAVNCAALPDTLLESELFGHEKGAFTGAVSQRLGRFELADNGTLLLDEIGEISPSVQVKLLRLIQERAFTRIGGTKMISCDVRIIAATNRDLNRAIEEGRFRDDLFYRLNVFPITLPPVRGRHGDVPILVQHFARIASADLGVEPRTVSPQAVRLLSNYQWPGNVREIANVLERAVLLADGPDVLPEHLPPEITEGPTKPVGQRGLRESERDMIVQALREHGWNQSQAARALGISRDNLRYRLKKFDITREEDR